MNTRLREAVEELERRLQTNYERSAVGRGNLDDYNEDVGGFTKASNDHEQLDEFGGSSIMVPESSSLEMFAELDAIDNIGDMTYHEKHAFNLEHMAGITCLIHLRMPSYMPLLDMSKTLGDAATADQDAKAQLKSNLGCTERKGFFFASADSFGNCRVWEVDRKSALFDFKF